MCTASVLSHTSLNDSEDATCEAKESLTREGRSILLTYTHPEINSSKPEQSEDSRMDLLKKAKLTGHLM